MSYSLLPIVIFTYTINTTHAPNGLPQHLRWCGYLHEPREWETKLLKTWDAGKLILKFSKVYLKDKKHFCHGFYRENP